MQPLRAAGPNVIRPNHVRTAPAVQGDLTYQPCMRPVYSRGGFPRRDAAALAAGPNVIR